MSHPVSRKHTTPTSVQRRVQTNASGTVPSSIPSMETQESYDRDGWNPPDYLSVGVIEDTQPGASGRGDITASRPSRTVASSHRSGERTKWPVNSRRIHNSRNSPIPLAADPNSRSPHIENKSQQAAREVSSTLDDAPPPELLAALHAVLVTLHEVVDFWTKTKGLPAKVGDKAVIQTTTSSFPDLRWDQSEPTRSQRSTTRPNVETTRRLSDPNNQASAQALEDINSSQHGRKSSPDAAGAPSLHREGTASIVITPGGDDPTEHRARKKRTAFPANKKGKTLAASKLNLGPLKVTINSETKLRKAFLDWKLDAITAGDLVIDLVELATATVEHVKPGFQQRVREAEEQGNQLIRRRGVHITEEIWQILFTIIANMFVYGLEPLYKTLKAACVKAADAKSAGAGSSACATDAGQSHFNDGVAGSMSEGDLFALVNNEGMQKLTGSLRWWWAKDDRSTVQIENVCSLYRKWQTVRLYDKMVQNWEDNEQFCQDHFQGRGVQRMDAHTLLLSYLGRQMTRPPGEANNKFNLLPADSPIIEKVSDMILRFRPICSLVEAFGAGVLLLMIDQAEDYVPGKIVGEGQEYYPQHERIRDVSLSLCEVDRVKFGGRLRKQCTELEEKILRPVRQLVAVGNTGNVSLDCPKPGFLKGRPVGKRIAIILVRIDVDCSTVQQSVRRSKRRIPHRTIEQAEDGEQGRSKRTRTESGEDEGSRTDSEDGLYSA